MSRKSSYNYSIRQFPSVQNQYTAIVSVSLSANNVSLSNYGIANPSTADTCNAVTIINAARADAQEQIKKQIRYIISNPIDEEHRDVAKIVKYNSD